MSEHPIVHIEFSTTDREASGKFYSEIFGWKTQQMEEMDYATFDPENGPGGGFAPTSETFPAGTTMVHIQTNDIEETLSKITAHGGEMVVPRTEIPEMGWFAIFCDPWGNKIGLYTGLPKE